MGKEKDDRIVRVDTQKRTFYWILMLVGIVLISYFTLNLVINVINAVDLAGEGVNVVIEDAVIEEGTVVKDADIATLHGVSGWVAVFSPWLALNSYFLALGAIFFGIGYVMTPKKEDRVVVSLFKMRILGAYLLVVSLIMLVLGIDRIFFLPHEAKIEVLAWIDWYIFEFLAHILWAVVLAVLSLFFLRVSRKDPISVEKNRP